MLGNTPLEEEIPRTREDLTFESQLVFSIYDLLPARWDGFSGQYMGKDMSLIPVIIERYSLEDYELSYLWTLIPIIDDFVAQDISKKIKAKSKMKEPISG